MAGVYDLPDDSTRLKDKEIKGEDEYNEEMRLKREGKFDNDIFQEKFEGQQQFLGMGAGGFKGKKEEKSEQSQVSFLKPYRSFHSLIDRRVPNG